MRFNDSGETPEMSNVIPIPRLVVRQGISAERESVAALVEEVWYDTYTAHLPTEWLQQRDREFFSQLAGDPAQQGWVAEIGNRIVGYGRVAANCVDQIWVAAPMRRRGVGSALLGPMLESIREKGFGFAQAGCEDFNLPARDFLAVTGWKLIHTEPQQVCAGHGCNALVHSIALR
jgi:GNAT superfamily N-acetyltransferase